MEVVNMPTSKVSYYQNNFNKSIFFFLEKFNLFIYFLYNINIYGIIHNILQNTNVKYGIIFVLIVYISTINPPLNNIVSGFYNTIIGKLILLLLIIYYCDCRVELGYQIAILLAILYIILLNISNTQNNIMSFGKIMNNSLIGGTDEDLLSSTDEDELNNKMLGGAIDEELDEEVEEEVNEEINEEVDNEEVDKEVNEEEANKEIEEEVNEEEVNEEEVNEEISGEEEINKKINNIIQEEIVLNKTDYKKQLEKQRQLGVKQFKLNKKLSAAQKKLDYEKQKYQKAENEYNSIIDNIGKYDTNKDGIIDFNDINPANVKDEEIDMSNIDKDMGETIDELKKIGGKFKKIVTMQKVKNKKK